MLNSLSTINKFAFIVDHLSTGWSFVCLKWKANVSGGFESTRLRFICFAIDGKFIRSTFERLGWVYNLNWLEVRTWSSLWPRRDVYLRNAIKCESISSNWVYTWLRANRVSPKFHPKVSSKVSWILSHIEGKYLRVYHFSLHHHFHVVQIRFVTFHLVIWSRKTLEIVWLHRLLHLPTTDEIVAKIFLDTFSACSICCFRNSWYAIRKMKCFLPSLLFFCGWKLRRKLGKLLSHYSQDGKFHFDRNITPQQQFSKNHNNNDIFVIFLEQLERYKKSELFCEQNRTWKFVAIFRVEIFVFWNEMC